MYIQFFKKGCALNTFVCPSVVTVDSLSAYRFSKHQCLSEYPNAHLRSVVGPFCSCSQGLALSRTSMPDFLQWSKKALRHSWLA